MTYESYINKGQSESSTELVAAYALPGDLYLTYDAQPWQRRQRAWENRYVLSLFPCVVAPSFAISILKQIVLKLVLLPRPAAT